MDPKDARFLAFWEKWKDKKWKFIAIFGGAFGLFMMIVFAVRAIMSDNNTNTLSEYLSSPLFLMHFIFLGLFSAFIYGWLMRRYSERTYQKIKEKYKHE